PYVCGSHRADACRPPGAWNRGSLNGTPIFLNVYRSAARKSSVKRCAGLALVLGLAAAIAVLAPVAVGGPGNVRLTCNTRAIDVYFWPHGHRYVKAYRFPAQKAPSLTVYRRGTTASRAFFFFLSPRAFNYANTCDLATNPLPTSWSGGRKTTIT